MLAQEPDKCGLSRASLSLSHLPFHSALTLVLMRRQGLTYIHLFNWNQNLHQPSLNKKTWPPILLCFFFFSNRHFLAVAGHICSISHIKVRSRCNSTMFAAFLAAEKSGAAGFMTCLWGTVMSVCTRSPLARRGLAQGWWEFSSRSTLLWFLKLSVKLWLMQMSTHTNTCRRLHLVGPMFLHRQVCDTKVLT